MGSISVGGNITGQGIAVGDGASTSVGAAAQQDELATALKELRELLAPLVFEGDQDAVATDEFAEVLEEVGDDKPRLTEISARGLLAAAANLTATIPALLPLVQRVMELVKR